ncbi:MAG: Transposase, Mutator family [Verrucomicrobia bacterium ADurb.Bin118]|jgi:transposase-like protein|nr:MAG: Transposase, Mutator family [Verrucomicrobia bacterium ADurb.Bin118]
MKTLNLMKGDTPMRACEALSYEPAAVWRRLQHAKPECFFEDLDQLMQQQYQQFLESLMRYERQCFLNVQPYERSAQRVDQANGFYRRRLTTRLGGLDLQVPRTRSGHFHPQVLPRYQRREPVINEALKQVFLLGVSTRQAGRALATLVQDAVSAATVSAISKALDASVLRFHRRRLADHYRYLILDGVSVRIRLVGKVQRRMVLCAYGVTREGKRELIDFQIVKAEGEDTWYGFLWNLWSRGLRGERLELIATDGQAGLIRALGRLWSAVPHQRCWAHKLRNLENKLKASQRPCLEEAKLIYQADHRTEAIRRFRDWQRRWQRQAPKAVACLEQDLEELLAFFDCPKAHWRRLRTTNVIERLFVEVRRRIRTLCAFTTHNSCQRILFSVFDRINTHWSRHPLPAFTQNS